MTAVPAVATDRRLERKRFRSNARALLWLAPALILVGFFIVYPTIQVIYDSFTNRTLIRLQRGEFTGLTNYRVAINDSGFRLAIRNNLILLLSVPISIATGLGVAATLFRRIRGSRVYQLLIFIPFLPAVASISVIFFYILGREGPLNQLLTGVGLEQFAVVWRFDATWGIWATLGIVTWKRLGLIVLLFTARLLAIDRQHFEMAAVDGASWASTIRHIALPQMRGIIQFAAVIGFIEVFSYSFAYVWVLGFRGSGILETYLFRTMFGFLNVGRASAVAVFLLILAAAASVYLARLTRPAGPDRPTGTRSLP